MKLYVLIDIVFAFVIINLIIYSYKKEMHVKLLEYVQIFIIFSISARFAPQVGQFFKQHQVILPDTQIIKVVFGFLVNLSLLFLFRKLALGFTKKHVEKTKLQKSVKFSVIAIEVIVLVTFSLYMFMQLTPSKTYLAKGMKQTYSYPYIKSFYIKFLNDDFLNIILDSDSDAKNYEKVIKSFKKIID